MDSIEHIAKILKADRSSLRKIDEHLGALTGKRDVFDRLVAENEKQIDARFLALGVSRSAPIKEMYDALISKIESDDFMILEAMGHPTCSNHGDCTSVLNIVQKVTGVNRGFFIKREKAMEFLRREPPRQVMAHLGYTSVDDMLAKEDLFEIYSALRFVEGAEWLNGTFFKQYEVLTPEDFEERDIVLQTISERWSKVAESFVKKKWHNVSHLKEMGVVFIIPVTLDISGELMRILLMIFHYLHEVPFYSDMFRRIARDPATFPQNLISLLRGDVLTKRMPENSKTLWLVVQRYLTKDDPNDWRLFVPRINPEAIHWLKAEEGLTALGRVVENFSSDVMFWNDLDWVGDYFLDDAGNETLVSFNLVDTAMDVVTREARTKFRYHQREALWNKIFTEYFGERELERYAKDYLLQGYFEV